MKKLFLKILLVSFIIIILVCGIYLFIVNIKKDTDNVNVNSRENINKETSAIKTGKLLSHNQCEDKNVEVLTHLPLDPEDFSILIPYGLMVGDHVTPIDHQYFAPLDYNSPRDSYEVYAAADGKIVEIGSRPKVNPNNPSDVFEEYRIVFSHSCTLFTYYDLVTNLSPELKARYDELKNSNGYTNEINYTVKSGELIGKIGGQTLDFAVWDTTKPLTGFINKERYKGEDWKIYTADPYNYFIVNLKNILIEKNPRIIEPIAGKIDYDIDGKLIGNWFLQDSGGYAGQGGEYWKTHFAIAPDHMDPKTYIISIGNFAGEPKQFAIKNNLPDPKEVDQFSVLTKYDLVNYYYTNEEGNIISPVEITKNPKIVRKDEESIGCVLIKLIEKRKMKLEIFKDFSCDLVEGFSGNEKIYER